MSTDSRLSYRPDGSGRDGYIHRDPALKRGTSERVEPLHHYLEAGMTRWHEKWTQKTVPTTSKKSDQQAMDAEPVIKMGYTGHVPHVNSIYGKSKQVVEATYKKTDADRLSQFICKEQLVQDKHYMKTVPLPAMKHTYAADVLKQYNAKK